MKVALELWRQGRHGAAVLAAATSPFAIAMYVYVFVGSATVAAAVFLILAFAYTPNYLDQVVRNGSRLQCLLPIVSNFRSDACSLHRPDRFRVGRHRLRAVHHRVLRARFFRVWDAVTAA
jgi:hypothetical protein